MACRVNVSLERERETVWPRLCLSYTFNFLQEEGKQRERLTRKLPKDRWTERQAVSVEKSPLGCAITHKHQVTNDESYVVVCQTNKATLSLQPVVASESHATSTISLSGQQPARAMSSVEPF